MVVNKPITKYCCSDTTQAEARIIAIYSIISSIFCLLILFLTFSQVKGDFFHATDKLEIIPSSEYNSSTGKNESCFEITGHINWPGLNFSVGGNGIGKENSSSLNEDIQYIVQNISLANDTVLLADNGTREPLDTELYLLRVTTGRLGEGHENLTNDSEDNESNDTLDSGQEQTEENQVICTEVNSKVNSNQKINPRKQEGNQLDLMAEFLLWDARTELKWLLPPFVWNLVDLVRGLLLLTALRARNAALAKLWWHMTAITALASILLFVPIIISLSNGQFVTIFSLVFMLVLSYNFYGMWIVNTLVTEITSVSSTGHYNGGFESDCVVQIEVTPIEKFMVN